RSLPASGPARPQPVRQAHAGGPGSPGLRGIGCPRLELSRSLPPDGLSLLPEQAAGEGQGSFPEVPRPQAQRARLASDQGVPGRARPVTARARGLAVAALVVVALVVVGHGSVLRLIGRALVVEDPVAKADAIVVVAGGTPSREEAAARLFREGLAPDVVLSNHFTPDRVRHLITMGARRLDYHGESRAARAERGAGAQQRGPVPAPEDAGGAELGVGGGGARPRGGAGHPRVPSPPLPPREARVDTPSARGHREHRPRRPRRRLPRRRLVAQAPRSRGRPPRIPRPRRHLPRHLSPPEITPRPSRGQRARRSRSTLSPPPRAPTNQLGSHRPIAQTLPSVDIPRPSGGREGSACEAPPDGGGRGVVVLR